MRMLFGSDSWRLGDTLPGPRAMTGYGFIIGLYSAVMGVGGGSVSTMILMLYGTPIHVAVGISAGLGVLDHDRSAPSASCSPAGRSRRCCRRCRSATSR